MTRMKPRQPFEPKKLPPVPPDLAARLDLPPSAAVSRLDPVARCQADGCTRNSDWSLTSTPGFERRHLCAECAEPLLEAVGP